MNRWTRRIRPRHRSQGRKTSRCRRRDFRNKLRNRHKNVTPVAINQQSTVLILNVNFWPRRKDSPLIQCERGVGLWLTISQAAGPHDHPRAKGVEAMITRTSQPASGAMLISEMKE